MINCYRCGMKMSDSALDGHVATAHPAEVMPMKPSEMRRIANKRGDDGWTAEGGK